MNPIPNILTCTRIGLIPLYWIVFFSSALHHELFALCLLLLAGLTDILDGFIARRYQLVTPMGILLDPLADKLMMLTVITSFLLSGQISWIVALLLFFRDAVMILYVAFFHVSGKKTIQATVWGKVTTVLYYIAFVANILDYAFAPALLWATVLLSFITSIVYLIGILKVNGLTMLNYIRIRRPE